MKAELAVIKGVLSGRSVLRTISDHYLAQVEKENTELMIVDVGAGVHSRTGSVFMSHFPHANKLYVDIDPRRGPTILADLTGAWPFRDNSVDLIFSSFVLEHLPDPFHFIKECSRCLRPGGRLITLAPFIYKVHGSPQDYLRFTDTFLEHCLNNTPGLCVRHVHPLGIGPVTNTVSLGLSLIPTAFLRTVLLSSTLLIDMVGLKFAALVKSSDIPDNLRRVYALGWVAEAFKAGETTEREARKSVSRHPAEELATA